MNHKQNLRLQDLGRFSYFPEHKTGKSCLTELRRDRRAFLHNELQNRGEENEIVEYSAVPD